MKINHYEAQQNFLRLHTKPADFTTRVLCLATLISGIIKDQGLEIQRFKTGHGRFRNLLPFSTFMIHIYCLSLQTHFPLSPPAAASPPRSAQWSSLLSALWQLCTGPGSYSPRSVPCLACPLTGAVVAKTDTLLKIMELDLSGHFKPRVPLFWWFTFLHPVHKHNPMNLGSCFIPLPLYYVAFSLLLSEKHPETAHCPCVMQSRSEETSRSGATNHQRDPSNLSDITASYHFSGGALWNQALCLLWRWH